MAKKKKPPRWGKQKSITRWTNPASHKVGGQGQLNPAQRKSNISMRASGSFEGFRDSVRMFVNIYIYMRFH